MQNIQNHQLTSVPHILLQNLKEKLQGALELKGKVLKGALEAGAGLAEGAAKVAPQIIATKAQVRETTD